MGRPCIYTKEEAKLKHLESVDRYKKKYPERVRASKKAWQEVHKKEQSVKKRKWRSSIPNYSKNQSRIFRKNNREKYLAHKKVQYALSIGKLIRPDHCESCGIMCKPEGHHRNYNKPLEVVWLCRYCHRRCEGVKK